MAAGITGTDDMFSVREVPWHGLGEVLSDYPTREEAQAIAHPWEPVTEPVYRRVPVVQADGTLTEEFQSIDGQKALVRSDQLSGDTLAVVPDTYEPVLNNTLWDIAEAIEGTAKGSVQFETGGSLDGGRKVWLMIRLRDPLEVVGDPRGTTVPYFLLQNSHDRSSAFRGQSTMVRVVCANTSKMADLDAEMRGTEFTFRHSKNIGDRIEEAKAALAGWRNSIEDWNTFNAHMLDTPVDTERFIEKFIPMPPEHMITERVRNNVLGARDSFRTVLRSETCEGIENTAYGVVQAAIEYDNHVRPAYGETGRFKRSVLNQSEVVHKAVQIATAV